jgi:Uma2 family endonuclease
VISRAENTVLVPDLCFVSARAIAAQGPEDGWLEPPPDLVVEVLSPSNRPGEMREKVADYVAGGCRLIWMVDPRRQCVTVHQPGMPPNLLHVQDVLDGAHVLPGFRLPLANLFVG